MMKRSRKCVDLLELEKDSEKRSRSNSECGLLKVEKCLALDLQDLEIDVEEQSSSSKFMDSYTSSKFNDYYVNVEAESEKFPLENPFPKVTSSSARARLTAVGRPSQHARVSSIFPL